MGERRRLFAYAAVALTALAVYHNALVCGFVLDDYHYILQNRQIVSWGGLPSLFWRSYESGNAAFFRPLATLDLWADKLIFGLHPFAFHLHNVLWHMAASCALLFLLQRVTAFPTAVWAALLFAVHPVHTEAVTGIMGRTELMAGFFVFMGVGLYMRGKWLGAALCTLAAPLCKESGLTLVAVAVVCDLFVRKEALAPTVKRALWLIPPLVLYIALRAHAIADVGAEPAYYFRVATPAQAFWTAVDSLGRYLSLAVWPHPLSADYSYAALPLSPGLFSLRTTSTVFVFVAWIILGYWLRRKTALLLLAAGLFLITIFPVSNLVVHIGVLLAERALYLPSFAVCLLGGAALSSLRARTRLVDALGVVLLFGLAAMTLARNPDWETPLSLWRDTVIKVPKSGLAHANLALSCEVISDRACALSELQKAVTLDPSRADFAEELQALEQRQLGQ